MSLALTVCVVLVAVAIVGVAAATSVRLLRVEGPPNDHQASTELLGMGAKLSELQTRVDALPSLWEHERQMAEAAKDEATKQHRKAAAERRKFEGGSTDGDGGDESGGGGEAERFLAEHGAVSDHQGVLPLRQGLEGDPPEDRTARAVAVGWTPYL